MFVADMRLISLQTRTRTDARQVKASNRRDKACKSLIKTQISQLLRSVSNARSEFTLISLVRQTKYQVLQTKYQVMQGRNSQ